MKNVMQSLVISSCLLIVGCGGGSEAGNTTDSGSEITTPIDTGSNNTGGTTGNDTTIITPPIQTDPTSGSGSNTGTGETNTPPDTSIPDNPVTTPTNPTDNNPPTDTTVDTGAISTASDTEINNNQIESHNYKEVIRPTTEELEKFAKEIEIEQNKENELNQEIKNFTPVAQRSIQTAEEYAQFQKEQSEEMAKAQQKFMEQQEKEFNLLSNISYSIIDKEKQNIKLKNTPIEAIPCDNAVIASYVNSKNEFMNLSQLLDLNKFSQNNYEGWFFISPEKVLLDNPLDDHKIFYDNELFIGRFLSKEEIVMEPTGELFENKAIVFKDKIYPVLKLSAIKLIPMQSDVEYDCYKNVYEIQKPSINISNK